MTRFNVHELAQQIVSALGAAAWTYLPPTDPTQSQHYAVIERCDGLCLCFLRYDSDKRMTISAEPLSVDTENGERTTYHYDIPKITVNPDRSVTAIAGDIRSRLLPDTESWYRVALHWQQTTLKQAANAKALMARLLTYPDASRSTFNHKVYGRNWDCEVRPGSSDSIDLVFRGLSPQSLFAVLDAFYQSMEDPMSKSADQDHMFPTGDDLPLFSGAPARAPVKTFAPRPAAKQPNLLDLRPSFGGGEPTYAPCMVEKEGAA